MQKNPVAVELELVVTVSPVVTVLVELNTTHESQSTGQVCLNASRTGRAVLLHDGRSLTKHCASGSASPLQS